MGQSFHSDPHMSGLDEAPISVSRDPPVRDYSSLDRCEQPRQMPGLPATAPAASAPLEMATWRNPDVVLASHG